MYVQVLQSALTWKQCADLPADLTEGQSAVVSGKVYYYGGSASTKDEYTVYCYDPQRDKWSTLPPLPIRYFGLGKINEKLVAIGGVNADADEPTNKVHMYDAKLERWKQMIAATMPSARAFPSVMSIRLGLVVAGGLIELYDDEYTDVVEIFQADTSQWYKTDPLPRIYSYLSTVAIDNTCHVLGETDGKQSDLEDPRALYATVDDLISNAVPANQTLRRNTGDVHSAWKTLPYTPSYQPAATMLDGHLLAIGGWQTSKEGARKKEVYAFSPSKNSWVYISDLPAPRTSIAVAIMTRMEILVIGGQGGDDNRVSTIYKGSLNLKL
jgi:N-acetylneuraminic acid mutarotase